MTAFGATSVEEFVHFKCFASQVWQLKEGVLTLDGSAH
jgi:hypothetical protein